MTLDNTKTVQVAATGSCFAALCPFLGSKRASSEEAAQDEADSLAKMYLRQAWLDPGSIQQGIKVPVRPAGKLMSIDLSWRDDLDPNMLQYVLHHAGVLKTLRVAAIATSNDSKDNMSTVAKHIFLAMQCPGEPVPPTWQQGVQYNVHPKTVLHPMQTVVAPGGTFAKVVSGSAAGGTDDLPAYIIDDGKGRRTSVSAAELGIISPICKGWGQTLRVLDVSCNLRKYNQPWIDSTLEGKLAYSIANMSLLEELYMASVPIGAVLKQLHDIWKSVRATPDSPAKLPPLKKLDVSAWRGLRTEEESELLSVNLEWMASGLSHPGAYLRTSNCFANIQDFSRALNNLTGKGTARDADLELFVPNGCGAAEPPHNSNLMEQALAGTSFCGAINCSGESHTLAAAVLRGLTTNACVTRLSFYALRNMPGFDPDIGGLAGQQIRDALRGFLIGNKAVKSLDLSENPLCPCGAFFVPYWEQSPIVSRTIEAPSTSYTLGASTLYMVGPRGKGWYDAGVESAAERKQKCADQEKIKSESQHAAWAHGGLAENKSITELNVEGCDLGDAGLTALGQALRVNRTLTALKIDGNHFSLDGLKVFKGCMYGNKKIVVSYPVIQEHMLTQHLSKTIKEKEQTVLDAKVQIKIACRGGRHKPHLGNPALKRRSLEVLREAKRTQGQCRRLVAKIQTEMQWIWGKIDANERMALEKQLAKAEARDEALYQKELSQQAKMHSRLLQKHKQIARAQKKHGLHRRERQGHNADDDGWSSDDYDYEDPWEAEMLIAADMDANDLALDAEAVATEAEAEDENIADLADVEAYAGAGPRDLWGGGEGNGDTFKVAAGLRACMGNEMRREVAVRRRAARMEKEEDVGRGTVACKYETVSAYLAPLEEAPEEQVTLVTQCSLDRLPRLAEQAAAYGNSPVSVAVYIPFVATSGEVRAGGERGKKSEAEMFETIRRFHAQLASEGVRRVTISLLFGNAPGATEYDDMYPINNLRNLALDAATSQMVLLVDVDFVPSPQLASLCSGVGPGPDMQKSSISYAEAHSLCSDGAVLVVPAFEVEENLAALPSTQHELASLWQEHRAEGFHVSNFPKGHSPTDFERWFSASSPYTIDYQEHFEPYVIACRVLVPRYDERFRGYGMNKISHLYEIAAAGATFAVLPHVFLTAREHARSASYQRVFGLHRDPSHAVRIALLWGAFKRQMGAKYPAATTLKTAAAAKKPSLAALSPSDIAVEQQGKFAEEDRGEACEKSGRATAVKCNACFIRPKGRKPVRIALQRVAGRSRRISVSPTTLCSYALELTGHVCACKCKCCFWIRRQHESVRLNA